MLCWHRPPVGSPLPGYEGKRVAISKNTIIDYATDQLLLHYNVDPQQLRA